MKQPYVCWSHGLEASPWGKKSKALAEVVNNGKGTFTALDYQGMDDPDERVAKLVEHLRLQQGPLILAGSSMGAYVSLAAARSLPVAGLFLVAPALYLPGYKHHVFSNLPTVIDLIHGWDDDVIPVENSIRFAKLHRVPLHVLPTDHRITGHIEPLRKLFVQFLGKFSGDS